MQDFEKLATFYLGKRFDLEHGRREEELLLYDAKDLTTHAVCVGMTGSGKTGLCLALLEEAAIDGVPAIAIDPKGDLSNLLLAFPQLAPADFLPWVDPAEAARKGMTVEQFAAEEATRWREGLADWGQQPERIARYRDAVDLAIYTPGSRAGIPLTVLRSFDAPPAALLSDAEALRERIAAATAGLLALLGINADPLRSREQILIAQILDQHWRAGRSLQVADLIRLIQSPPLDRVGVIDLETFFPAADRFALAMAMNNLLASPGFAGWMEGEPLDVQRLLYTAEGKPRLSIVSIAHLSDAERMFFVTILLSEVLAWVRAQPGTSALRALLYMDEIYGYFPPTANPPSKAPMLTLLKQARAFGLGVVLATQNPVDLDYKGLSNAGTWFLGRLQTERDKARVLEGLEGAAASAGRGFDRRSMEATLAALGSRVFLMNNVHEDAPVVFQSRWALSYLRGPLTRQQIQTLMRDRVAAGSPAGKLPLPPLAAAVAGTAPGSQAGAATSGERPLLPPEIDECFRALVSPPAESERIVYRPTLLGLARLHYVDTKTATDEWRSVRRVADAAASGGDDVWEAAGEFTGSERELADSPSSGAQFGELPAVMTQPRKYKSWTSKLKDHLYRSQPLTLWKSGLLGAYSRPEETEQEFRIRLQQLAREQRELQLEKLRGQYAAKLKSLDDKLRRAEQRVRDEQGQYQRERWQSAVSVGSSMLGALFGRKLVSSTTVSRAATAARGVGRAMDQRTDVEQAEQTVEQLLREREELETGLQAELAAVEQRMDASQLALESIEIKPRKSDVTVERLALLWQPYRVGRDGIAEPAFSR